MYKKGKKRKVIKIIDGKKITIKEQEAKSVNDKNEKGRFYSTLSLVWDLGFAISLPIVGGAFLGRFLDDKLNSSPRMTLSLIFLGLMIGLASIYYVIKADSSFNSREKNN